ncbi:MAG: hypothetical protein ABSH56_13250 [Bryobacteraceae bacterium]|jgi:hypothetical protein
MTCLRTLLCVLLAAQAAFTQGHWGVQGRFLTQYGRPTFVVGANYIPSAGWYTIIQNWNPEAVEKDFAALQRLGVKGIRFPLLWPLLQSSSDTVNKDRLANADKLIAIAAKHGISVQVGPITGWMSGAVFLPSWADGNLFTDPSIIEGATRLVREVAGALKGNAGLQGYDFGNEINVLPHQMGLLLNPAQTQRWMATIFRTFKQSDPSRPVTNGIGTGFDRLFDIWSIAQSSDYLSVHSYPFFHGTSGMDPWIGQRTTYSSSYIGAYAAMADRPVLVQEIGCSEAWLPRSEVGKFLRLTLMGAWAEGSAGYYWWGSHDIDRNFHPPAEDLILRYSAASFARGQFSNLEYTTGLLDLQNRPKPSAEEFRRWTAVIDSLGLGWRDELPVLYLLYPQDADYSATMRAQITPYTLAKQIHMQVRLWPEWKPAPADAAAMVIPGFSLSARGRETVGAYLRGGGVVYQSYFCDFPEGLTVRDVNPELRVSTLIPLQAAGRFAQGQPVQLGAEVRLRDAAASAPAEAFLTSGARGVLFGTAVGKGHYYYLAANLEESLSKAYEPWQKDESWQIYSVLRPETDFTIDSAEVELFIKSRFGKRLALLLNRSDRFQNVIFQSAPHVILRDFMSRQELGGGHEIALRLPPAGILIAEITAIQDDGGSIVKKRVVGRN